MKTSICGIRLKAMGFGNFTGSRWSLTNTPRVCSNNSSMASLPPPDTD